MPNIERLKKLENHLRNGILGHSSFDFSIYNDKLNLCGTNGCAIGECPVIFEGWIFNRDGMPIYADCEGSVESGCIFFDILENQYSHLFIPQGQDIITYGGIKLYENATRIQVADNMKIFIELCENNLIGYNE